MGHAKLPSPRAIDPSVLELVARQSRQPYPAARDGFERPDRGRSARAQLSLSARRIRRWQIFDGRGDVSVNAAKIGRFPEFIILCFSVSVEYGKGIQHQFNI